MKLQDFLYNETNNDVKYGSFIVYNEKTDEIIHIGFEVEESKKHETSKTKTLQPLVKHTISAEQMKEYLSRPSLYSW